VRKKGTVKVYFASFDLRGYRHVPCFDPWGRQVLPLLLLSLLSFTMKVTTKGRGTIPQAIREKLGIIPNSEVDFEEEDGRVYLVNEPSSTSRGRLQRLRGIAGENDDRRDHGTHQMWLMNGVLVDSNVILDVFTDDPV
jgi:AbrB family looped-hinge helix DNA binding protein